MTDYPISSEDGEMSKVREIFERALNAIIAASELSKQVEHMRGEVGSLRSEIDNVRAYNQRLDVELTATREQRDQALRDKQAALSELNQSNNELRVQQDTSRDWQYKHEGLSEAHEGLKKEHDNVQMQVLELEDENKSLKGQLERIKAAMGIQPRDPATGTWQSPAAVLAPQPEEPEVPKVVNDPFWR